MDDNEAARAPISSHPRPKRLLRIKQVIDKLNISRTMYYLGVQRGYYPKPYKISERSSVWLESDIDNLIDRIAAGHVPGAEHRGARLK